MKSSNTPAGTISKWWQNRIIRTKILIGIFVGVFVFQTASTSYQMQKVEPDILDTYKQNALNLSVSLDCIMLKDPILFFNLLDRIGRTGVVGIQIDGNHPTCVERDAYLRRLKASHLAEFDTLSHEEAIKLIFQPGFSTSESVSGISGRGIGMDAVKSKIKELGGTISVKTAGGRGSTNHQAL